MSTQSTRRLRRSRWRVVAPAAVTALTGALIAAGPASAATHRSWFEPGNLVVSGSVYTGQSSLFTPGVTQLPPGCTGTACAAANADGSYPGVFDNDLVDPSFGVTSPIFLDQVTPTGGWSTRCGCRTGPAAGGSAADHVVTSFSSKSELALNLSTNGRDLTFMGYDAAPDTRGRVELQHSRRDRPDQPGHAARTTGWSPRSSEHGRFRFTQTNAYSGNNGRAAILNDTERQRRRLHGRATRATAATRSRTASSPARGAQILTAPAGRRSGCRRRAQPTPVGSFSVTQLGDKADKIGKDTNFRGLTIFNNVVYFTKGSGGNGVNTVYFIDTTGTACPSGVGLPQPGAALPTSPIAYDPAHAADGRA